MGENNKISIYRHINKVMHSLGKMWIKTVDNVTIVMEIQRKSYDF